MSSLHLLAVGCGGFLGALSRYGLTSWILRWPVAQEAALPLPTLLANLIGCFLIGFLKRTLDQLHWLSPSLSLFLFMGFLGSFTTFSTFGFESWRLLENGRLGIVLLYASASLILGITLVWLGYHTAGRIIPNPA